MSAVQEQKPKDPNWVATFSLKKNAEKKLWLVMLAKLHGSKILFLISIINFGMVWETINQKQLDCGVKHD